MTTKEGDYISIGAWYLPNRADPDYRIGIVISKDNMPQHRLNRLPDHLAGCLSAYDRTVKSKKDVKYLFDQLHAICKKVKNEGQTTLDDAIVAMMNIYWLEQRGHLKSDDQNGMQFIRLEKVEAEIIQELDEKLNKLDTPQEKIDCILDQLDE